MSKANLTRATVVTGAPANTNQINMQIALFNPDGTVAGTVKKAAAQADSTATDVAGVVADFNALLAKLRTAGVIASS